MLHQKFNLAGRTALVTGSTRGIGKAIAFGVVAALVGWAVTWFFGPAESAEVSRTAKGMAWQSIFWFSMIPAFFLFFGSFRLKESPRGLFRKGRREEARPLPLRRDEAELEDAAPRTAC